MTPQGIATGRRTTSSQSNQTVATTSNYFLSPAPTRVAVIVSAPATNRFTLSLAEPAVLDQGITLYPGKNPLILTVEEHGDIVTKLWTAIGDTVSQTVEIIEVFLRT